MSKPKNLDNVTMTGLNSIIASHGAEFAVKEYKRNIGDTVRPAWEVNYLRLYHRYNKEKCGGFIDIKAAERALREA